MKTKTVAIVLAAMALILVFATLLAAAGLWIGVRLIGEQADAVLAGGDWSVGGMPYTRGYGGPGMMGGGLGWNTGPDAQGCEGPGVMAGGGDWDEMPCAEGNPGAGGVCGDWGDMPCGGAYVAPQANDDTLSLEAAEEAVARYVERLGSAGLHITEVMEFERNFYAIVAEEDTGIGAMELLVAKATGAVGLEPGPNMMWNAKYGMHGGGGMGMMGGYGTAEMTLSTAEAEQIAQRWLDANLPGRTAGEADPFYGYYTLHFLRDGEIEGMLSVHGSTGDVWYHSWHGDFVAMIGDHDE